MCYLYLHWKSGLIIPGTMYNVVIEISLDMVRNKTAFWDLPLYKAVLCLLLASVMPVTGRRYNFTPVIWLTNLLSGLVYFPMESSRYGKLSNNGLIVFSVFREETFIINLVSRTYVYSFCLYIHFSSLKPKFFLIAKFSWWENWACDYDGCSKSPRRKSEI